jgi:hypothetical protein
MAPATFGSKDNDYGNDIIRRKDGGYMVAGQVNLPGATHAWLVGVDASGILQWQQVFKDTKSQRLTRLLAHDGGVYAFGRTLPKSGKADPWIIRVDAKGKLAWQTTVATSAAVEILAASLGPHGGLLIGGYADGPASGVRDAFVARLDSQAKATWTQGLPQTNPADNKPAKPEVRGITVLADGRLALAGAVRMQAPTPVAWQLWARLVDPWGNTACHGACFGETPLSCDDGDPKTLDACDPKAGLCVHAK